MRLFIAVNFNDETKQQILKVQEQLRSQSVRGNFTRPENLHLTLIFLGETPENRLDSLHSILKAVTVPSFKISFTRTGCFKRRNSELWWLGTELNSPGHLALAEIQKQLAHNLESENFNFDKKPLNTHITLGREVIHNKPINISFPNINTNIERSNISLKKSEHIKGVLTYTNIYLSL